MASPYFHSQALQQCLAFHVREAAAKAWITPAQQAFLQPLLDGAVAQGSPRVDRLLCESGAVLGGEASAAWIISDPQDPAAPLFLHTLLGGLEPFADRAALLQALNRRFFPEALAAPAWEVEAVSNEPFTTRMLTILDQQAEALASLAQQLDSLPSLAEALAESLQDQVDRYLPQSGIEVRQHLVQRLAGLPPAVQQVVGTQTLAEAALDHYAAGSGAVAGRWRFLDVDGQPVDASHASLWASLFDGAVQGLAVHFEALLLRWWSVPASNGLDRRGMVAQALAEAYRTVLLNAEAQQQWSKYQQRRLASLLCSQDGAGSLAVPVLCQRLVLDHGQPMAVKLAGVLALEFVDTWMPGLYLFSAAHGLRHFASPQALQAHLVSERGQAELRLFVALEDQAVLAEAEVTQLRLDPLDQAPFTWLGASVVALQMRNLRHVLGLPAIEAPRAEARLADALDIRDLLDARLAALHDGGRWTPVPGLFGSRWAPTAVAQYDAAASELPWPAPADSWYVHLQKLDQALQQQSRRYDGVEGCMRRELNRYLAVVGDCDARELWIEAGGHTQRLLSLALSSAGTRPTLPAGARILRGSADASGAGQAELPANLLEAILGRVCAGFAERYRADLLRSVSRPLRWLNGVEVRSRHLLGIRDSALRLALSVQHRQAVVSAQSLDDLQQLLDLPGAALRVSPAGGLPLQVYSLWLAWDTRPAARLADAWVIQRGTTGPWVLWSLCDGISVHAGQVALEHDLAAWLEAPHRREDWLAMLEPDDQRRLRDHLASLDAAPVLRLSRQALDGHWLDALWQAGYAKGCDRVVRTFEQAVQRHADADLRQVMRLEEDRLLAERSLLDHIGFGLETLLSHEILPDWLERASTDRLVLFNSVMQRLYVTYTASHDFLFDIPDLGEYADQRLRQRLEADFPGQLLDPYRIDVTLTHYVASPVGVGEIPSGQAAATERVRASLVDYAVRRFSGYQDGVLSLSSPEGELPESLTADYLRTLVHELDIATAYRQLLASQFAADAPEHARRLAYFTEQMPPLEIMRACALLLCDALSLTGYRYLEAVLNMPDGLGRLPVGDTTLLFSPLQLSAAPGRTPDPVSGAFIIAPQAPQPGPWLLYTVLNPEFMVREFADQAALLAALRHDKALQAVILARLEPEVRRLYDHGGFAEPHLPFSTESDLEVPLQAPAPATLVIDPLPGNALHAVYDATVTLLQWWIRQQSLSNAEDDRLASRFLWSLGAEQVMSLLPGRLGLLMGLWQSQSLLQASVTSVAQRDWGKAISELLAAVGVAVTARQGSVPAEDAESVEGIGRVVARADESAGSTYTEFSWGNHALDASLVARLRTYQASDVVLNGLRHDPLLNTYQDTFTGYTYAAVEGGVYRIDTTLSGWRIVDGDRQGPPVARDDDGTWHLALRGGLKGGGAALTRLKGSLIEVEIDRVMVVEARGMAQIRQRYRHRAMALEEGHEQARRYLETALDNLEPAQPGGAPEPRAVAVVGGFFDMAHPDTWLLSQVRSVLSRLYAALTDSSLSPQDSMRYVVGTNRLGEEHSLAFTFEADPQKRIFLTEKFFREPQYRLRIKDARRSGFMAGAHYRATILLHELSHLYCDTHDIAYVDSHVPFVDLLEDDSAYRRQVRNEIIALQQNTLSFRTDRSELFRQLRDDGSWSDIRGREGLGKQQILRLTGKPDLEQARSVFYADPRIRAQIMLLNADSVTLLVTLLGRRRLLTL